MRRYQFVVKPQWLLLHLLTIAAVITMVLLGRWQLRVSNAKHFNIQNFGYAIQWWLFSAGAVVLWVRLIRDGAHRDEAAVPEAVSDEPVAYRRYVMPVAQNLPLDGVHAAYNDYLANLAEQDAS